MITDLETLLNQDEFKNLVDAINKNQKYYLSNDGLIVKAESTDNSLFLLISYDRQKEKNCLANEEIDNFQKYLESLDDDLFIDVCESFDKEELKTLQETLDTPNYRNTISTFKNRTSEIAKNKFSEIVAKCDSALTEQESIIKESRNKIKQIHSLLENAELKYNV